LNSSGKSSGTTLGSTIGAPNHMKRLSNLVAKIGQVELVSSDVFDTLLLRTLRSERSRILRGERLFSDLLQRKGFLIPFDVLVDTRIKSQSLVFRVLEARRSPGEARLEEIIGRQLALLGLPQSFVAERVQIEIEVEKTSLAPAKYLANILSAHRRAGARIVATSDTTFSSDALRQLIDHFYSGELVERIYSSADLNLTKRHGALFEAVAKAEGVPMHRMIHVGDDWLADIEVPTSKGINVQYVQHPQYRKSLRRFGGALTEAGRAIRSIKRAKAQGFSSSAESAAEFGLSVFGPIVAQFCLQIWLYAEAKPVDESVLLFCARGGVGIRQAFEHVLSRLSLPTTARRENFLISRLVAARAALLSQRPAALETIGIEFRGRTFAEVASALGGRSYELAGDWNELLDTSKLFSLFFGRSGAEVLADISEQHVMFDSYFRWLTQDADRVILVDTGLYGSTQRLLASAYPDKSIETIQFARSNYKGQSEDHFSKVAGLVSEYDHYYPFSVHSCVLRYWHLIEKLFEPKIPSVRSFSRDASGAITANCGNIEFNDFDATVGNDLLSGAVEYLQSLPVCNPGIVVWSDAEVAWLRLKRAITRPTWTELEYLEVGNRSVDFGRSNFLSSSMPAHGATFRKLIALKSELWREGSITHSFPLLKHILLPMLDTVQAIRGLSRRLT
jgi:FMN phosphatase YigB (HAD superfamily)